MTLYRTLTDESTIPSRLMTDRLILRVPRGGDGPMLHAAICDTFHTLTPWMPWARRMPTIAESETFARESAARFRNREDAQYLVFHQQSGPLLGTISLHSIDWSVPRFEVGYWLRNSAEGHGYITEAVRALTALCFEQLGAERMEIRCDSRNTRSAAVAQRAGYQLEAVLRRQARDNAGALRDTLIFVHFPYETAWNRAL